MMNCKYCKADCAHSGEDRELDKRSCYIPMTNGDRIRSMTDEELDEFLEAVTDACYDPSINHCRNCPMLGHRVGEDFCNITNWLKQLAEE